MNRFIETPNLPQGRVTCVIADTGSDKNIADELRRMGINIISTLAEPNIAVPVSRHADMLVHHLGGRNFVSAESQTDLLSDLKSRGAKIRITGSKLCSEYPGDIALNFARVGNCVFGRIDKMADELKEHFVSNNIVMINTNQGYAKCSTAVADKNSIITSDSSIASAALKTGMNVLCISPGNIELIGYDTGFIGGCCGKMSSDIMAFTGNIKTHPDRDKITAFLRNLNIYTVCLGSGILKDIGGILPVMESE